MGNCKNCKWYNYPKAIKDMKFFFPPDKKFGVCSSMNSNSSDAHLYIATENAKVIVGQNFGCIHFEQKS